MIWWALEQRRKRAEKAFEENWKKGRAEVIAEMLATGIPQTNQELDEWARERGIVPKKAQTARKRRGCCCCRCA